MKWEPPKSEKVQTSSFHQNTLASHSQLNMAMSAASIMANCCLLLPFSVSSSSSSSSSLTHTSIQLIHTLPPWPSLKTLLCPTSNHSIPSSFLCSPFLAKALSCCHPHHVFGRVTQGWQEEGCHRWRRGCRNGQQFTKSSKRCFSLTLSTVLRCHPRTASGKIQDHHHRAHVRSRRSGNIYTP